MENNDNHLTNLAEIRSIMERTTSFISLSGLSGVFAGIFAIIGASAIFWQLDFNLKTTALVDMLYNKSGYINFNFLFFAFADAFIVLFLAIGTSVLLSIKKAHKKSTAAWDSSTKRLLGNLFIPLIFGGLFGLILLYYNDIYYLFAVTLIFYGLALINASKYTLRDIKYLGVCEASLGLLAAFFWNYAMIIWTVGFGLLHIIYGTLMYYKYDR